MQYGLLGRKLSHSLSPQIHALLGTYPYALFEREEPALPAFFGDKQLAGFNVTIPYKTQAYAACDARSETATRIGAVNTVIRRPDGTLFGDNTDYFGFCQMADRCGVTFQGKKVLILGSGGASRMVQVVCKDRGAREIIVVSRSGKNDYGHLHLHRDADILVNATPVGMYPNNLEAPVDLQQFPNLCAVLDLIYNPLRTALLLQAEALKIPCCNGLRMLVAQALRSAELFTGHPIALTKIDEICQTIEATQRNVILIGMPGCGKSTVAKALAEQLHRRVLDTDTMIEDADGRTIPQIFEAQGEAFFRALETAACEEAGKQQSVIIATGGGAVLSERNRAALKQNGVVIYLKKELTALATDGRPLSKDIEALQSIYQTRKGIYETYADGIIPVDPDVFVTTERVISCICSL